MDLVKAHVRALVEIGAFVCIGDLNRDRGLKLEQELSGYVKPQLLVRSSDRYAVSSLSRSTSRIGRIKGRLFKEAEKFSPSGKTFICCCERRQDQSRLSLHNHWPRY